MKGSVNYWYLAAVSFACKRCESFLQLHEGVISDAFPWHRRAPSLRELTLRSTRCRPLLDHVV